MLEYTEQKCPVMSGMAVPADEKTQVNGKTLRLIKMAAKARLGLIARSIAQL